MRSWLGIKSPSSSKRSVSTDFFSWNTQTQYIRFRDLLIWDWCHIFGTDETDIYWVASSAPNILWNMGDSSRTEQQRFWRGNVIIIRDLISGWGKVAYGEDHNWAFRSYRWDCKNCNSKIAGLDRSMGSLGVANRKMIIVSVYWSQLSLHAPRRHNMSSRQYPLMRRLLCNYWGKKNCEDERQIRD